MPLDARVHAMHPGLCERCESIYPTGTKLAYHHGQWVHQHCVPGGDDE